MRDVRKILNWSARAFVAGAMMISLSACGKSEPTYSGISLMGRNYLPYNMDGFTITDAYGDKASGGGGDSPGAGGGSVTCCYKLKGTEFTVTWNYYDTDQWHKGDEQMFHGQAKVSMPPTQAPESVGQRLLEVHFYPDRHVEFQFPGGLLDSPRVPMIDAVRWIKKYQAQLDKKYDEREDQQYRRVTRVVAAAWIKYRLTDVDDVNQYVYFNLLVNHHFDAQQDVQKILQSNKDKPGGFAKAMASLSPKVMSELTTGKFSPVAVPAIPAGLLPPPRVQEKQSD